MNDGVAIDGSLAIEDIYMLGVGDLQNCPKKNMTLSLVRGMAFSSCSICNLGIFRL